MWAAARGQIEGILGGPPRGMESGSVVSANAVTVVGGAYWCHGQLTMLAFLHVGGTFVAPGMDNKLYLVEIQG